MVHTALLGPESTQVDEAGGLVFKKSRAGIIGSSRQPIDGCVWSGMGHTDMQKVDRDSGSPS